MTRRASIPWLPLLLLHLPGGCCLRGPGAVTGSVGGNLHVQCRYEARFKENAKYWCRDPCWDPLGTIVKTSESGREARSGRTSIRDDPANLTFTVTLEGLTEADAGTYCCGIDKPFTFTESWIDPRVQVTVSVSPDSSATPRAVGTTHSPTPAETFSAPGWTMGILRETLGPSQNRSSLLGSIHFLLLVFLKLPLLLSMLSAVLWVNRPQRRPGGRRPQPDYENQPP